MNSRLFNYVIMIGGVIIFMISGLLMVAYSLYTYDSLRYGGATISGMLHVASTGFKDANVGEAFVNTFFLAGKGFILGLLAAAVVIFVIGHWPKAVPKLIPPLGSIRAIPLTLLIPLLVLFPTWLILPPWSRNNPPSSDPAYLIALGTLLNTVIGFAEGVANANKERIAIAEKIMLFSKTKILFKVLWFEVAPHLLTSLRVTSIFALVLAIVVEQLTSYPGIGYLISQKFSSIPSAGDGTLEAECLILLFMVAVVGVFIDFLYVWARRVVVYWIDFDQHNSYGT